MRPALAEDEPEQAFERAPDPAARPGPDADLYVAGVELQRKRKWLAARRKFWQLLDRYPDSPYAPEAEDRSGPNAFLGIHPLGPIGPRERRIDVALMADGYRIREQRDSDEASQEHLQVLLREPLYRVYRPYFNFWRFNLASEDKGVDEPLPPEPDDELRARQQKRRRPKRGPKQYSTALDCREAGPQGQVWANPRRVWHYLQYLDEHDSLVIAFAQMGKLGMGGMGIATTGPRGVVVHEFGHAFIGLLDEYVVNSGKPPGIVNGLNATSDRKRVPWQHFLDAEVRGVGVFEGGASFQKGVWRPARGCAMNNGGGAYCPVCREAGVLSIYERVSPIDEVWPKQPVVEIAAGTRELPEFRVLPMAPVGHELKVRWILGHAPEVTSPAEKSGRAGRAAGASRRPGLPTPIGFRLGTVRRAMGTAGLPLPKGIRVSTRTKRVRDVGKVHIARMPMGLPRGRHLLTAIVWDPTPTRGGEKPWVLKDERGLLEARHEWLLVVQPARGKPAEPGK